MFAVITIVAVVSFLLIRRKFSGFMIATALFVLLIPLGRTMQSYSEQLRRYTKIDTIDRKILVLEGSKSEIVYQLKLDREDMEEEIRVCKQDPWILNWLMP